MSKKRQARVVLFPCPTCGADLQPPAARKPPGDEDFLICIGCGGKSPWAPLPSKGAVRLVLRPLGATRARLELRRGGRLLDILGTRKGTAWAVDGVHEQALRRVLPVLEERSRKDGEAFREAFVTRANATLSGLHRIDGNRQHGGPPP